MRDHARRLRSCERALPNPSEEQDATRSPPSPEKMAAILGHLFDAAHRDKEAFVVMLRARLEHLPEHTLEALLDDVARFVERATDEPAGSSEFDGDATREGRVVKLESVGFLSSGNVPSDGPRDGVAGIDVR